jgi:cell shape-determining protein MreC
VTSGLDRLFPKGLPVGSVRWLGPASGLFREVLLVPAADLDKLDQVLVLVDNGAALDLTQSLRPRDASP